jgi:hypothetical protein
MICEQTYAAAWRKLREAERPPEIKPSVKATPDTVRDYVRRNPGQTFKEIAGAFGVSPEYIGRTLRTMPEARLPLVDRITRCYVDAAQ